ncbi:hypothetical protein [Streptomyces himalayensis]|uniref:Uncharacterized protein n=1 Tax=Streptomyces himalayensis subsp. himalayensis TaxID=2756131 RepID=A0A7W0DRR9_9ACTN|nr:hypothetical protein [Streptomyces himalayensis]MBA2950093.1 hypothetical protein [Streptomyces himalayensis subsp. himalayensis]
MQEPTPVTVYQSSFAACTRTLDPGLLETLRISESAVLLMEAFVSLCKALTNDSDPRPWQERVEDCFSEVTEERLKEMVQAFVDECEGEQLQRWVERFKNQNYSSFAERLLGAATYKRFIDSLKQDGAVVALAVRRGVRALTPFIVAWNDAVKISSQNQLKDVQPANILAVNAVEMLVSLDDFLGEKVLAALPMELTSAKKSDLATLAPEGIDDLVASFRSMVAEASVKRVERRNSPLVRKIRGARDALRFSEDGVSQAANSLIELLDRIMRESFKPAEVLAWVDGNLPDGIDLTHEVQGQRRPTKRAEALCFVYGGDPIMPREASDNDDGQGPDFIHDVIAISLVSIRNQLQKMKHADHGTPEEKVQLLSVLAALEGALMLGLTIGSLSAEPEPSEELPAA